MLECAHADMKKQHIARHDIMMRMLIKGVTKGTKGNHNLIADVGTADTLKDIGAQQTAQICATRLSHSAHNTRPSTLQKPFDLQGGQCTEQDEARHDGSSMVEMADTEQHTYLPHDTDTGSTLPNLPATMPNGRARRVTIVEGGYCSDVSYLEKVPVKEKGQKHAKLEEQLRLYGYNVTSLTYICGCTGSQYHSSNDTIRMLGIEHSVAKKLRDKPFKDS